MDEEIKNEMNDGAGSEIDAGKTILPPCGLAEDILGKPKAEESAPKEKPKEKGGNGNGSGHTVDLTMKYVTFFLDKEEYALPISEVQEINRIAEITRVPNAPTHVLGVVNLRGKIVPVIELKKRLNLGKTDLNKDSRIVIVENGTKIIGLLVDRVSQVLNIGAADIEAAPVEVVQTDENYIKSVCKLDSRMIILLDLQSVIGIKAQA